MGQRNEHKSNRSKYAHSSECLRLKYLQHVPHFIYAHGGMQNDVRSSIFHAHVASVSAIFSCEYAHRVWVRSGTQVMQVCEESTHVAPNEKVIDVFLSDYRN